MTKEKSKLTKRQQDVYKLFLSKYPESVDRFAFNPGGWYDAGISLSVINVLVRKGYLICTNPKISAYDKYKYQAVLEIDKPKDETRMTLEQSENLIKKLSKVTFIRTFRNPQYSQRSQHLLVTYFGLDRLDCLKLADFAKENDLNFYISSSNGTLEVMFWNYKHEE